MMNKSSFALLALLALAGCSASREETGSASADVVVANSLVDQTIVKGKITVGETAKVGYEPYAQTEINGVPYLAWELVAPSAAATGLKTQASPFNTASITIGVVGDFPGEPDVVIVDESFGVLGTTKARSTGKGEEASIVIDTVEQTPKFVLVRDTIWVAPMDFEITVSQ